MPGCSVGRISEEDCRINTTELQTHTDMNDVSRKVTPVSEFCDMWRGYLEDLWTNRGIATYKVHNTLISAVHADH